MSNNINLLLKKNAKKKKEGTVLVLFRRFSMIFLGSTVFCSALFFILTFDTSLSSIKQQENAMLTNLSFTQGKIAKYLFIKDRLSGIRTILQTRYPMDTVFSTVLETIPSDVTVTSFDMTDKLLSLHLASGSLLSLNTAATNIATLLQNNQVFKKIIIESVVSDPREQTYTLSLQASLL